MNVDLAAWLLQWTPRIGRFAANHRADPLMQSTQPPIEDIAADLRRLLWEHERLARISDVTGHRLRVCVLEAAITDRARQAARALGVPHPDRPAYGGFDHQQLGWLLRALTAEGLVLPAIALLARNRPG